MKATTSCTNVVKEIRYQVFKGIEKESVTIAQFKRENLDNVVKRSGLIYLSYAISMPPLDALAKGKIKYLGMKDGKPQLIKLSHNYMYQVQIVRHISRRKTCNFVAWTPECMVSLKIQRDKDLWKNKMVTNLLTFFYDSLLPKIIYLRHPRNMPICERSHIKSAQEAKREKKKSETRATVETTKIICEDSC
ncbi:hypothetical protein PR048_031369, partial [Dryococelus australis]